MWGIRAFDAAVIPTGKPVWINFSMDYRVFGYLGLITIATAILFGLAPALRLARMDLNSSLKDGGRAGVGIRGKYLSGALVVGEVTLAVVLLTGAGLMMRSFLTAYSRPAGVDTANLLTMPLELPRDRGEHANARMMEFQRKLTERLRALPGVETATVATSAMVRPTYWEESEVEGRPSDPGHRLWAGFLPAGEGYFEALRLRAVRGRVLTPADQVSAPMVAVMNQAMANKFFPKEDPLGKRFRTAPKSGPGEWITVVGIIPDFLQDSQQKEPEPLAIVPIRFDPGPYMTFLARTRVKPSSLANAFRREVQAVDPDLPIQHIRTMEDVLAQSRWHLRVFGTMFSIFAGIALLLATVGLYAVVAYGVNQRTQEIGVRVALGASGGTILRMVFATGMRQAGIGLLLGLAAAAGVTRVLASILVGVTPTDPVTFSVVAAILLMAAILGCAIPARRAMRVDPAVALRHQ